MSRSALITHVDEDLAIQVKTAADRAGITASKFIARALVEYVEQPAEPSNVITIGSGKPGAISSTLIKDVEIGNVIVLDSLVGMEVVDNIIELEVYRPLDTPRKVRWMRLHHHRATTSELFEREVIRSCWEPCVIVHPPLKGFTFFRPGEQD